MSAAAVGARSSVSLKVHETVSSCLPFIYISCKLTAAINWQQHLPWKQKNWQPKCKRFTSSSSSSGRIWRHLEWYLVRVRAKKTPFVGARVLTVATFSACLPLFNFLALPETDFFPPGKCSSSKLFGLCFPFFLQLPHVKICDRCVWLNLLAVSMGVCVCVLSFAAQVWCLSSRWLN